MRLLGTLKQVWGGRRPKDVASATNINIPAHVHSIRLTGTTAVVTITQPFRLGQLLRIRGPATSSVVVTNNNDPSTLGQIDAGGTDLTMADEDYAVLVQRGTSTLYWWERFLSTDN